MKRITLEEIEKNGKFETYEAVPPYSVCNFLRETESGEGIRYQRKETGALSAVLGHGGGKRLRVAQGRINLWADAPDFPGLLLKEPVTL